MKSKILNVLSTIGILISFGISIYTDRDKVSFICWFIMAAFFILLLVNVLYNRKSDHLDGILFFDFARGKKNIEENTDNIDIDDFD